METLDKITPAVILYNGNEINVNIKKIKYCPNSKTEMMYVYNMDTSKYESYPTNKCKIVVIK